MSLSVYKASAGSGKTYTLVREYIGMLFEDMDDRAYRRILAVTFTHKATNEMKQRVIQQLYNLAIGAESPYRAELTERFASDESSINRRAATLLVGILQDYSSFSISTIDSFFQRIVRCFAREVGLSGSYTVRLETDTLLQQAIDVMFADLKEGTDLFKWLIQYTKENIQEGKSWNIRNDIEQLGKQLFAEQYLRNTAQSKPLDKNLLLLFKKTLIAQKTSLEQQLTELAGQALQLLNDANLLPSNFKGGSRSSMLVLMEWTKGVIKRPTNTFNTFAESVEQCLTKTTPAHIKDAIQMVYPRLQPILQCAVTWWKDSYRSYATAVTMLQHLNTMGILGDIEQQLRLLTNEQNVLPISDTNVLLNRIIGESDTPFVYEKIGVRYKHYMLDEFQDTSSMQWDNFRPLVEESVGCGHKNLVVGDVKQSIYRWRNSDWTLLNGKIQKDITACTEQTLPNNYRSGEIIVEFNNRFFEQTVKHIAHYLQQEHTDAGLENTLQKAYETIRQIPVERNKEKGFVEIVQQLKEDKQDYQTWATNQALQRINSLLRQGVNPKDVTLLVRRNKDAQHITSALLAAGHRVVSNEGLCINNAVSVRFLVHYLLLQLENDLSVRYVVVNYYYLKSRGVNTDEAIRMATHAGNELLFTEKEKIECVEINKLSLCDRIQQLIGLFNLGNIDGEEMFVQCFLDIVFKYVNENNADTRGFLEWWGKSGKDKTIPCPSMDDAINVMTIHQSKGLEFKHVIIPFVWDIKVMQGDILWCQNPEKTHNTQPQLLPISSKENLIDTHFADTYLTEKLNILIDNLNLLYVAFTRAVSGLYCMTPYKESEKINNTALLINAFLHNQQDKLITTDEATIYKEGKEEIITKPKHNHSKTPSIGLGFRYNAIANRLKVKNTFIPHQLNKPLKEDRRRVGIIMHDILKNIRYEEDFNSALNFACVEGKINLEEIKIIEQELQRFKKLVSGQDWFSKKYIVHNEASILLPNGITRRPDRLIINPEEKKAIVVDYKFGEKMEDKYLTQVKEYINYISQMGYQCRGYLCYVEIGQIITV